MEPEWNISNEEHDAFMLGLIEINSIPDIDIKE